MITDTERRIAMSQKKIDTGDAASVTAFRDRTLGSRRAITMWQERRIHRLKTWPSYWEEVVNGVKDFELRKDDRGFREGDILILAEYYPITKKFTGRETRRKIKYILYENERGLKKGYCILGLESEVNSR